METTAPENQDLLVSLLDAVEAVHTRWGNNCPTPPDDVPITCSKGCGACCHFPVIPATAGEAFVLYHLLEKMSGDTESLREHLTQYANRYLSHARAMGSLPLTHEQQLEAFQSLSLPCPLLLSEGDGKRGSCGFFQFRPLICSYFHSTDNPSLCASKSPHGSIQAIISAGEDAVEELLCREREIIGRSTLGHLPLLLAAFATAAGREALQRTDYSDEETEALPPEEAQGTYDFMLWAELLKALGYTVGEKDIHSLLKAREELKA